jgi:hypothetical protein
MTTALTIIDRAYTILGYKDAGEPLSADDANQGLNALNSMVDSWNTQRLFIVSTLEIVGTVSGISAGVGPALAFNTLNPVTAENGGFARIGGIDYPIEMIDRQTYAGLTLKTVQSTFPQYAYFDRQLPTSTLYFYPVPSAAVQVHIPFQVQLTAFADLATDYGLAQGYQRALELSLAEELSMGLRDLPAVVVRNAANARRAIRRSNVDVPLLNVMPQNTRFNIYSGM